MGASMNIQAINLEAAEPSIRDASAQIQSHYNTASTHLPGAQSATVRALRDEAIAGFAARGLPHRRVEEWKYTDLRNAMPQAFQPAPLVVAALSDGNFHGAVGPLAAIGGFKMVFVNGRLNRQLSSFNGLPGAVELLNLAEALESPPDWLFAALSQAKPREGDVVTLLNTAFASDGVVLRLGKSANAEQPVHLIHIATAEMPVSVALRNVLILEEGAEASVIETYVSQGQVPAQINSATEIALGEGSRLRHFTIAAENTQTQHLATTQVRLAAKADYLGVQFAVGGSLSRLQTFMTFEGEAARAHFSGCQLMRGRQHCDMTLVIDHAAVGCESREHVKVVLDGHARGVFQAKAIVRAGAQKTDGRQMAQSLLLSETAEFDAKPELEIYADDVKCNHGATCGAIDDDLLFYLRARGIPEDEAKALLIQAFIGEILDRVEDEGLRQALEAKAAAWLTLRG